MSTDRYTFADRCLIQFDLALRTLVPGSSKARRASPADDAPSQQDAERELSATDQRHIAGLMRINHTGEVCAQALYQGQAATARLDSVRQSMEHAASEEIDHLAWCEGRLNELESRPSMLNPLWYGLSYSLGAVAGIAGDKWSLGFVAETEQQVCVHLEEHLESLPQADQRSKAILQQMLKDEREHGENAKQAGGAALPLPVKTAMTGMAKIMKATAYRV